MGQQAAARVRLFALFIGTFGRSITALRIGGVLCVWAASSILYVGAARLWGRAAGWTAALVVIVGCATLPSGQATMTEHLALVPLSVVLIGLLKGGLDRGRILALGGVAGLVTLIKADTASLAIAATIIVALDHGEGRWPARKARVALFAAGVCLPFLATVATYAASGHVGILRTTLLDASFAYVTQTSVRGGRWSIIELIWTRLLSPQAIPGALAVGGIILIFGHGGEARRRAAILVGVFIALFTGLVVAGQGFSHYLLVEMPVVGVSAGALFHVLWRRRGRLAMAVLLLLTLLAPLGDLARRYVILIRARGTATVEDPAQRVARYLVERGAAGRYVFLDGLHIAGWLSRAKPPSKYVHPSNLRRLALLRAVDGPSASIETELLNILAKRPVFLVLSTSTFSPIGGGEASAAYRRTLLGAVRTDYELDQAISGVLIFRRADLPPDGPVLRGAPRP
jgi:hypothetical protein